jgi:hypothetical protein
MNGVLTAWRRCLRSLRTNLLAGLIIWSLGIMIYLLYGYSILFQHYLDQIAELKKEFGYLYSAFSTGLFGGLIPFLALLTKGRIPKERKTQWFCFFLLFWSLKGVEVDAFYRLQSFCFGESAEFKVVLCKVVVDQFLYCVIWSAPVTAILYGWKDAAFKWSDVVVLKDPRKMTIETLFLLFSTWIIWIPAVAIIYSMPENLQIPLFNLTLCFFVLVITIADGGVEQRWRDRRDSNPRPPA